ncbi:MAG: spermidine synthase [Dehalococcoidia bacterium DG_18]|nr:MAG: spermidine synthase [Dehalococcoidia bacterium DG_18]
MNENEWFHDYVTPDMVQSYSIKEVIYSGRTQFQSVEIIESGGLGRCLILDGKIQSSEWDEFIYHEALVHPPMIAHPRPERVFIAGGGEGATLREVLAHSSVKRVVMVDIDEEVIDICRRLLPSWHQGSFEDSRLELRFVDARKYLEECVDMGEKFDVVILDLPEPIEGGPAYLLHTTEFYQVVREKLAPDGILSLQAGASSWGNHRCFTTIINTLKAVFPLVFPYDTFIPSYGGTWGFALASPKLSPPTAAEVERRIASRITGGLRFYDGIAHQGLFSLPKNLREAIAEEKTVITTKQPFFIYQP